MKKNKAFVAMTTVLIVGVVIWLMLIAQALMHLNESLLTQSWRGFLAAESLARGCAQLAYQAISANSFYAGQNLSWGENSCIIEVSAEGDDYQIMVRAKSGDYYKKINTRANLASGNLTVNEWQELE